MMLQNQALGEPMTCAWDGVGVRFVGNDGTSKLAWQRMHRWLDDDASFVFLRSDRLMHVIPKRVLTDALQRDLHAAASESGVERL